MAANFLDDELHVKSASEGSNVVSMTFMLLGDLHSLHRDLGESCEKALRRLDKTYLTKLQKKGKRDGKKKKNTAMKSGAWAAEASSSADRVEGTETKYVLLFDCNSDIVDAENTLNTAWKTGMRVLLSDGRTSLKVVVDPPSVALLHVWPRGCLLVGCPVVPTAELENCDSAEYWWYIERQHNEWTYLCSGDVYVPTAEDETFRLKVYCIPTRSEGLGCVRRGRAEVAYLSKVQSFDAVAEVAMLRVRGDFNAVPRESGDQNERLFKLQRRILQAAPSSSSVESSSSSSEECRSRRELRVLSYNVLAEPFATSDHAMTRLFGYCNPAYLQSEYRSQLVALELLMSDADVICLQECDRRVFFQYYKPLFSACGYSCHYTNKSSGVAEGCATISGPCLRVLRRVDVPLKRLLRSSPNLAGVYAARPDLREVLGAKLGSVAQVCVCRHEGSGGALLVLSNTHLFYHPLAGFARLLQADAVMGIVRALCEDGRCIVQGQDDEEEGDRVEGANYSLAEERAKVVYCGDLNSTPETAVIEYLEGGAVSAAHEVWAGIDAFRWGARDCIGEEAEGVSEDAAAAAAVDGANATSACCDELPSARHPYRLKSAAGYPEYTNYTRGFRDLLDYIYVQEEMRVARVAPFPSEPQLQQHTALPSRHFPSDHLAVMVDLVL